MKAFQRVMKAASKDGALSGKIKELIAPAIAINTQCQGCIFFQVQSATKHHAIREEVSETIAVSVEVGRGSATVYGAKSPRSVRRTDCMIDTQESNEFLREE